MDDEMISLPHRRGSAYMEVYGGKDPEGMGSNRLAMCGRRGEQYEGPLFTNF